MDRNSTSKVSPSRPGGFPTERLHPYLLISLYLFVSVFALSLLTIVQPHTDDGLIHQIGKNCALVAFILLAMQALLAARFHWMERPFGMDMLLRYHRAAAVIALGLLVLHPTLIAWGSRDWSLITGAAAPIRVWLGRTALLLLVVNVAISFWRRRMKIEFQRWRRLHNGFAIAILSLAFLHSSLMGGDLSNPWLWAFWVLAFALFWVLYLYHRAVRPALLNRSRYTVSKVRREAANVWTVELAPPEGREVPPYLPGQFQYITFFRAGGLPVEEHHWTISSTPTRSGVSSTIKESGDFTSTIGLTRPGDTATVQGPYGRFSYLVEPKASNLLFLCGGIGITPFLGMLRHMHDTGAQKDVLLLWSNRTEEDIVAREEIERIEASGVPQLRIVHFLTQPGDGWKGERGRIGGESLARHLGREDLATREVFVCCPPLMSKALIRALRDLRVPPGRIHYEGFSL
ncbi:MAG: ferredoxin reductase family protein [Acidobacteriota bacterium]